MAWFIDQYVPEVTQRRSPYASPLLATDHSGLPQAIIVTAEFDPLRNEGEAYAVALRSAGVPTERFAVQGMLHGFVSLDRWFSQAGAATDRLGAFLKDALSENAQIPAAQ